MARFKRGDRVVVTPRQVTAADRKSGLYYAHFAGLHGTVDQVYEEEGEVCVEVDQDSLPESFERRHLGIQEYVQQRWLNGISEHERRNLPEEQRSLRLKYTIMVAPDDLVPEGQAKKSRPAEKAAPGSGEGTKPATPRLQETDLTAAEEAYFEEIRRRANQ
ncbi:MAG TPA: hypothetical protein PLU39_15025 [Armatimonadota bacterium]|nr:hypothetical protein [Armatimonadota bacterium]HOJ20232.1 hypothetical protein [Armatimonadota bacterium]HOM81248.1 hypothetical protein [Armatimonadota bacterium]HOQ28552.1 hypothetical protein [Armatimonadota bacterium]HPO73206.1 hypothetical protein [Armatimonadota bacterium]